MNVAKSKSHASQDSESSQDWTAEAYKPLSSESDEFYVEEVTTLQIKILGNGLSANNASYIAWPLALYLRLRGLLGFYTKPMYARGTIGSGRRVDASGIPPLAALKIAPFLEQLLDLRFKVAAYRILNTIGQKEHVTVGLLDEPGSTVAVIEWQIVPKAHLLFEHVTVEFDSFCDRDPELMTGLIAPANFAFFSLLIPPFIASELFPIHTPLKLAYENHVKRLAAEQPHHFALETVEEEFRLRAIRRHEALQKIGLLRRATAAEILALRAVPENWYRLRVG